MIKEKLEVIAASFFNSMAMANFEARLLTDTFFDAYKEEASILKNREEVESGFPHGFRAYNLNAIDLKAKKLSYVTLTGVVSQGSGTLNTMKWNCNDHICWQLVNAYELFETFVKELYALYGTFEKESWRGVDYGKLPLGQTKEWGFVSHKHALKNKDAGDILNQLRRLLPELEKIEVDNVMTWDIKVRIAFIELMRHVVVHKKGKASLEDFIDLVGKKSGIAINTESSKPMRSLIGDFFVPFECEEGSRLLLGDLESEGGKGTSHVLRKFDYCITVLASYGAAIYELTAGHFGVEVFWKEGG